MPEKRQWIEPDAAFSVKLKDGREVTFYRSYFNNDWESPASHWFQFYPDESVDTEFDIRNFVSEPRGLSGDELRESYRNQIQEKVDSGELVAKFNDGEDYPEKFERVSVANH